MSVTSYVQRIISAKPVSHDASSYLAAFDAVKVNTEDGSSICLFLPPGTGASVAAAINAAVMPPVSEEVEA